MIATLATVVVLLAAVLTVPVMLTFRLATPPAPDNELRVRWAFGLVDVPVPLRATESPPPQAPDTPETPTKAPSFNAMTALRDHALRLRLLTFLKDLWRAIDKRDVLVEARIGLGDPADTGRLWAALGPLSSWLGGLRSATVRITPDFGEAVLDARGQGTVRFVPIRLLWLTARLAASPTLWRGLRAARRG